MKITKDDYQIEFQVTRVPSKDFFCLSIVRNDSDLGLSSTNLFLTSSDLKNLAQFIQSSIPSNDVLQVKTNGNH